MSNMSNEDQPPATINPEAELGFQRQIQDLEYNPEGFITHEANLKLHSDAEVRRSVAHQGHGGYNRLFFASQYQPEEDPKGQTMLRYIAKVALTGVATSVAVIMAWKSVNRRVQ
jgi:hypothetical protein